MLDTVDEIFGSVSFDDFYRPQINPVALSLRSSCLLLLKRSATLQSQREKYLTKYNFSKATSSRSKVYYPP